MNVFRTPRTDRLVRKKVKRAALVAHARKLEKELRENSNRLSGFYRMGAMGLWVTTAKYGQFCRIIEILSGTTTEMCLQFSEDQLKSLLHERRKK